jgi:hypothetical protein
MVRGSSESGDPGEIAVGHFIVQDGFVHLTDEAGKPLNDVKPEVLPNSVDPKSVAARMTRRRRTETGSDFWRTLDYPPWKAPA